MSDVASRWYGRQATPDEVDEALHGEPYDDLQGASGVFLAAVEDGRAVGCAGVRFGDGFAELTKVFTRRDHRGQGLGGRLLGMAEQSCAERNHRRRGWPGRRDPQGRTSSLVRC
ncbi:GNAT family N-acetyltransferase [Microbacterium terregens]